jgi:hypothetical protein
MRQDDDILLANDYRHVLHSISNASEHYKYPMYASLHTGSSQLRVPQQWHERGYTAVVSAVERLHACRRLSY